MSRATKEDDLAPWHPRMRVPGDDLGWTRIPVIAFLVFAVGPSVLAPILFVLNLAVDLSRLLGPLEKFPNPLAIFVEPIVLTLGLWPFLVLYNATRNKLIEDRTSWRSIRVAMTASAIAMSLPSTFLLLDAVQEMSSSARDAGQGTGILLFLFMIFLPILGAIGWLIGRGIAWILRY